MAKRIVSKSLQCRTMEDYSELFQEVKVQRLCTIDGSSPSCIADRRFRNIKGSGKERRYIEDRKSIAKKLGFNYDDGTSWIKLYCAVLSNHLGYRITKGELECAEEDCEKRVEHGAHCVFMVNEGCYILPTCQSHNPKGDTDYMYCRPETYMIQIYMRNTTRKTLIDIREDVDADYLADRLLRTYIY